MADVGWLLLARLLAAYSRSMSTGSKMYLYLHYEIDYSCGVPTLLQPSRDTALDRLQLCWLHGWLAREYSCTRTGTALAEFDSNTGTTAVEHV
eukprot:COSAG01_NODE_7493_length_3185_cov_101.246598_2_plen_93_part_00